MYTTEKQTDLYLLVSDNFYAGLNMKRKMNLPTLKMNWST